MRRFVERLPGNILRKRALAGRHHGVGHARARVHFHFRGVARSTFGAREPRRRGRPKQKHEPHTKQHECSMLLQKRAGGHANWN